MDSYQQLVQLISNLSPVWSFSIYALLLVAIVVYFKITRKRVEFIETILTALGPKLSPITQLIVTVVRILCEVWAGIDKRRNKNK